MCILGYSSTHGYSFHFQSNAETSEHCNSVYPSYPVNTAVHFIFLLTTKKVNRRHKQSSFSVQRPGPAGCAFCGEADGDLWLTHTAVSVGMCRWHGEAENRRGVCGQVTGVCTAHPGTWRCHWQTIQLYLLATCSREVSELEGMLGNHN